MYRDTILMATATALVAGLLGANATHAVDAQRNPLHPMYYYSLRVHIAEPSNVATVDTAQTRNPLHPQYTHLRFAGKIESYDAQTLAQLDHHNPLHPSYFQR